MGRRLALLVIFTIAQCLFIGFALAGTPPVQKVRLRPVIRDGRFRGVKADDNDAKKVELRPGDKVTFSITREPNQDYINAEEWDQTFKTEDKDDGFFGIGGYDIITHNEESAPWSPKWGTDIVAVVSGSDPTDFTAKIGLTADRASYRCNTNTALGQFQFSAPVNPPTPSVQGPPGSTPESDKPTVKLLLSETSEVGILTITVTRPSSGPPATAHPGTTTN